jgi:hypothetical protein
MSFARGRLRRVADADSPFYTRSGFDPPKGPLRTGTIDVHTLRGGDIGQGTCSWRAALASVVWRCGYSSRSGGAG